jgi:hypothetical protein
MTTADPGANADPTAHHDSVEPRSTDSQHRSQTINNAKPRSHSEYFGLTPQEKPTQIAGSGRGSGIEGSTGVRTGNYPTTATKETNPKPNKVAGMDEGSHTKGLPGAASSSLAPSMGSCKIGE